MRPSLLLAALLILTLAPEHADAKRIFVPRQHRRIQAAVNAAAAGDTIWVAPGIYYGTITVKKRLVIFADQGPEKTVLDGHDSVRVVHVEGVKGGGILGFRIQNGKAPGGSGVYCLRDTAFILASCDVRGNWETGVALWKCENIQIGDSEISGNHGTGMTSSESKFQLLRVNFRDNHAATGGGMNLVDSEMQIARECLFETNRADGGTGGGIFGENSMIRIANCTFRGNTAASGGGGIATMDSCEVRVRTSLFTANRSNAGGAVLTDQSYCDIQGSVFDKNRAMAAGAAVQILGRRTAGVNPILIGNTFYKNGVDADQGGTIFAEAIAPEITRNIFVIDSTAKNMAVLQLKGVPRYECNLVQTLDGNPMKSSANLLVGDPLFCDAEHGDFHVRDLSPALLAPCGKIGALGKGSCGFKVVPSQ